MYGERRIETARLVVSAFRRTVGGVMKSTLRRAAFVAAAITVCALPLVAGQAPAAPGRRRAGGAGASGASGPRRRWRRVRRSRQPQSAADHERPRLRSRAVLSVVRSAAGGRERALDARRAAGRGNLLRSRAGERLRRVRVLRHQRQPAIAASRASTRQASRC